MTEPGWRPEPGWYPDPSGAPRQLYFDGTTWRGQHAGNQLGRGRRAYFIFGNCMMVLFGLLTPWLIIKGGYNLWAQHTGTPARVEIQDRQECEDAENYDLFGAFGSGSGKRGGPVSYNCVAVWRPDGGTQKTVTVYGVSPPTPRFVDARIHGERAFTNSLLLPFPLLIAVMTGGLVLLRARRLLVRRRARRLLGVTRQ